MQRHKRSQFVCLLVNGYHRLSSPAIPGAAQARCKSKPCLQHRSVVNRVLATLFTTGTQVDTQHSLNLIVTFYDFLKIVTITLMIVGYIVFIGVYIMFILIMFIEVFKYFEFFFNENNINHDITIKKKENRETNKKLKMSMTIDRSNYIIHRIQQRLSKMLIVSM